VGIGSSTPGFTLGVAGTLGVTGQTTLVNASSTGLTATNLFASLASLTNASTTGITATNFFTTNLNLSGLLRDGGNASGTQGQVLLSTGTGTQWTSTSSLGISGGSGVTGGVFGYAVRFLSATTLGTSTLIDNGTVLGVNATSSSYTLNLQGTASINPLNIASSTGAPLLTLKQDGSLEITKQIVNQGVEWTARSAAGDNDSWRSVTYGNGLFVAVSESGDRVMTSPDGINWTARSAAGDDDSWRSVTYGNGLFVAAGVSGDRVMTSPDGINWTARSAAGDDDLWYSITYGNGLFVAVGQGSDFVITSPDGINWTARSAAGDNDGWYGVTYGNGRFVAVSVSGDRVMHS
jgi:hypothetical protein